MSNIEITLPDGSKQSVAAGRRPIDIAKSISPRLADAAIVAKVNGELYDLTRPIEQDATLQILTTKDPEALEVYRHSTAHLLAAAVLELYPETKLGIGPPIENGFYYDFDRATPFTPEDLEKIEKKMWEIQARNLPYERVMTAKDEGLRKYADDWMKCELIDERAGEVFSEYTLGPHFIDFCRGPHVPDTSKIKAFKLLSIAGAYWKGDEHNKQLQRIYGTAFFSQKDLDEYLQAVEEAKKRDHRKLGKELDLFSIQELAGPGLIFFHPKGGIIRKHARRLDARSVPQARLLAGLHAARGALRPVEDLRPLRISTPRTCSRRMELDDAEYQLKPMNCPFHILIYARQAAQLSRPAGAARRAGHGVPLRALRRAATACCASAASRRTTRTSSARRSRSRTKSWTACSSPSTPCNTYGFDKYEAELSTWDGGASGKYDGTPEQWELGENALQQRLRAARTSRPR